MKPDNCGERRGKTRKSHEDFLEQEILKGKERKIRVCSPLRTPETFPGFSPKARNALQLQHVLPALLQKLVGEFFFDFGREFCGEKVKSIAFWGS